MDMSKFTPIQKKIVSMLLDGEPHKIKELMGCIDDELADYQTLRQHMSFIRPKIRPGGIDIICQFIQRQRQYRMVRLYKPNSAE